MDPRDMSCECVEPGDCMNGGLPLPAPIMAPSRVPEGCQCLAVKFISSPMLWGTCDPYKGGQCCSPGPTKAQMAACLPLHSPLGGLHNPFSAFAVA